MTHLFVKNIVDVCSNHTCTEKEACMNSFGSAVCVPVYNSMYSYFNSVTSKKWIQNKNFSRNSLFESSILSIKRKYILSPYSHNLRSTSWKINKVKSYQFSNHLFLMSLHAPKSIDPARVPYSVDESAQWSNPKVTVEYSILLLLDFQKTKGRKKQVDM